MVVQGHITHERLRQIFTAGESVSCEHTGNAPIEALHHAIRSGRAWFEDGVRCARRRKSCHEPSTCTKYLAYLQDVAFQKYVVMQAFPGSTVTAHLLMPDKSKTATENGLNQCFKVKRNGRHTDVLVDDRAKHSGLALYVFSSLSWIQFDAFELFAVIDRVEL